MTFRGMEQEKWQGCNKKKLSEICVSLLLSSPFIYEVPRARENWNEVTFSGMEEKGQGL